MSQSSLPINTHHVALQFQRRDLSAADFFYQEIARRMNERLQYIRTQPEHIVDAGCGQAKSLPLLSARYPNAHYTGIDICPQYIQENQQAHSKKAWHKLLGTFNKKNKVHFIESDFAQTPLKAESIDMVWSNLALHWHPEPHKVIDEWRRLLKTHGLCMFSCLGPSSFQELRSALSFAGIKTQTPSFVDMHDFGDILLENGFMDPVMDQEIITFTYQSPQKLLADVKALGGNPCIERTAHLVGKQWLSRLYAGIEKTRGKDGLLRLSLEVAYGHGWRKPSHQRNDGSTLISFSSLREQLKTKPE